MAFHGTRGSSRGRGASSGGFRGRGASRGGPRGGGRGGARGGGRGGSSRGRGRGKPVFDSARLAQQKEGFVFFVRNSIRHLTNYWQRKRGQVRFGKL